MDLQIPEEANVTGSQTVSVCVGDDWYRYPSSFFLPGSAYRLQFVKSSFDGMLPIGFSANQVCALHEYETTVPGIIASSFSYRRMMRYG